MAGSGVSFIIGAVLGAGVYPLNFKRDGVVAALSSFTFRALAAGSVDEMVNGKFRITLNQVAVYLRDVFNFDESKMPFFDRLGVWSCEHLHANVFPSVGYTELTNEDFRNYRTNTGKGKDFVVLSNAHLVEGFEKKVFWYEKK